MSDPLAATVISRLILCCLCVIIFFHSPCAVNCNRTVLQATIWLLYCVMWYHVFNHMCSTCVASFVNGTIPLSLQWISEGNLSRGMISNHIYFKLTGVNSGQTLLLASLVTLKRTQIKGIWSNSQTTECKYTVWWHACNTLNTCSCLAANSTQPERQTVTERDRFLNQQPWSICLHLHWIKFAWRLVKVFMLFSAALPR